MTATTSVQHENRLARETSPYLLQHKDNPVDWWAWGPEALAEAKRTDKPILLSVGYAACHWCHVMAHESFEDDATARVMNELFVNIKVDREERPDIDQIYMAALHHLGEQGGWPLTMFLTPDGEPIWGGTYFPKYVPLRQTGFRRRAARDRAAVPRGAAERSSTIARRSWSGSPERRGNAGHRHDRRRRTRQRRAPARRPHRSGQRRHARRAEIPAGGFVRAAVARRAAHRRSALLRRRRNHARPHLRGRHLRSPRRRLLALFGRRALARAAFRENALRQRAAPRTARDRASAHRQAAVPAARRRRPSPGSSAR